MLQPAYKGILNTSEVITKYPNSRKVTTDSFFLGTSPVVKPEQIGYIKSTIDTFFKNI